MKIRKVPTALNAYYSLALEPLMMDKYPEQYQLVGPVGAVNFVGAGLEMTFVTFDFSINGLSANGRLTVYIVNDDKTMDNNSRYFILKNYNIITITYS
jgi:hypothetical protein